MGTPRGLEISRKRDCRGIRKGERGVMTLNLVPLDASTTKRMLPLPASRDQVAWYWGNGLKRAGRVYESAALTFLGVWLCYFMTYVVGSHATSAVGGVVVSHCVLAPILVAYFKNKELRGNLAEQGGNVGTQAAIFFGRVVKGGVVEQKRGNLKDPVSYRMDLQDELGRKLAIRAPFVDSYRKIALGMSCQVSEWMNDRTLHHQSKACFTLKSYVVVIIIQVLVISNDRDFEDILGVSDAYVPDANLWIGSYPYINKVGQLDSYQTLKLV